MHVANPFELMMNPQAALAAVERLDRMEGLQRRICRPLDRQVLTPAQAKTLASDLEIERDMEPEADDPVE